MYSNEIKERIDKAKEKLATDDNELRKLFEKPLFVKDEDNVKEVFKVFKPLIEGYKY